MERRVPLSASPPLTAACRQPLPLAAIAGAAVWLLLGLAALGRGGEAGWAQGLVLLAGGIGAATIAAALTGRPLPRSLLAAGLLWLVICLWCLVQSLPLPALAHPLWAEAAATLSAITGQKAVPTGSIALDPHAARSDGLRLAAYAGLFALGLALAQAGHAARTLGITTVTVTLFAAAALLLVPDAHSTDPGKIRHAADAVFPFTNRNTFCAFAGAGLIVCLASLTAGGARRWPLWLGMAVLCSAGVLAAHSRAGLAATAIGCATALMLNRPSRPVLFATLAAAAALAVLSLLTLTTLRLAEIGHDLPVRLAIWQASAAIAADHFWLGLGSLDQALQMQPGDWGERHIRRAHNIYLQSVAERGLPATMAAIAAILLCARHAWRAASPPDDTPSAPSATATKAAALGVLALFASHGLVDFSLYAPVNAAILALLLGLACGNAPPALPRPEASATNAPPSPF